MQGHPTRDRQIRNQEVQASSRNDETHKHEQQEFHRKVRKTVKINAGSLCAAGAALYLAALSAASSWCPHMWIGYSVLVGSVSRRSA